MDNGVINANRTFQTERPLDVAIQFWKHPIEEVEEVVLPHSVVGQSIAPTAAGKQIGHIQVIHSDMIEAVANGETFAEHHQPRQRQPFPAGIAVSVKPPKAAKKVVGIQSVPDMARISHLVLVSVGLQGVGVDVIHSVMLEEQPVHAVVVGVPNHASHFLFRAMVVSLVVASERTLEDILVDVDRPVMAIRLGHGDGNDVDIVEMDNLHISVHQKIHVHLAAVGSVPEHLEQLLWRTDSFDDKAPAEVILTLVLLDAKQDCSTLRIGESGIGLPQRLRQASLR